MAAQTDDNDSSRALFTSITTRPHRSGLGDTTLSTAEEMAVERDGNQTPKKQQGLHADIYQHTADFIALWIESVRWSSQTVELGGKAALL